MNKITRTLKSMVTYGLLSGMALLTTQQAMAQPKIRTYANFQGSLQAGTAVLILGQLKGSITNAPFAADGLPNTASTLAVGVGLAGTASVTQYLEFTTAGTHATVRTIGANTPVTLKLTVPAALLSVASGISAGYYTGLNAVTANWPALGAGHDAGWQATTETVAYSGASLLNLLNGMGEIELTITPPTTFNGVFLRLEGNGLALGLNNNLFHAYISENAPGNITFGQPIDVLSGVRAGSVVGGVANATGSVTNPWNAIDAEAGSPYTTYAQLNTGAQLLSEVFHTTVFNTACKAGDSVALVLQNVDQSIVSLGLLTGFTVNLYNGNTTTPVQTISNSSSLLQLRLLPCAGNIYSLSAASTAAFDRVEVKLGGVAAALSGLRIYNVSAIRPKPTVPQTNIYTYAGQSAVLNATTSNGDVVAYYDAATGGNVLPSATITTTTAQAGTVLNYFAGTTRTGFTGGSLRAPINVNIIGFNPPGAIPTGTFNAPYSGSVAAGVPTPGTLPNTPVLSYAITAGNVSNLTMDPNTGAITGTPSTVGTYNFTVTVTDVANSLTLGSFPYTLNVQAPLPVQLMGFTAKAKGSSAVLNWEIANEADLSHFVIERSANSRDFVAVGKVDRKAGVSKYDYTDAAPGTAIAYYRLNMTDKDGKTNLSPTRSVVLSKADNPFFVLAPNPSKGEVRIALSNQQDIASLTIIDISGKVIRTLDVNDASYNIPLAAGVYFVRAVGKDDTQVQVIRAVVQ